MNILSESIAVPDNNIITAIYLSFVVVGLIVAIVTLINKSFNWGRLCAVLALMALAVGIVYGIIVLSTTQEHVINVTLDDNYSATELLQHYKVRKIEGKIYTLVEYEDK